MAFRETVTLVYLIKTLVYGKHREKVRTREKGERKLETMFHFEQSKFDTIPRRSQRKKQNKIKTNKKIYRTIEDKPNNNKVRTRVI